MLKRKWYYRLYTCERSTIERDSKNKKTRAEYPITLSHRRSMEHFSRRATSGVCSRRVKRSERFMLQQPIGRPEVHPRVDGVLNSTTHSLLQQQKKTLQMWPLDFVLDLKRWLHKKTQYWEKRITDRNFFGVNLKRGSEWSSTGIGGCDRLRMLWANVQNLLTDSTSWSSMMTFGQYSKEYSAA